MTERLAQTVELWPGDGRHLVDDTLDRFLAWCSETGTSRIEIQIGRFVHIEVHHRTRHEGRITPETARQASRGER